MPAPPGAGGGGLKAGGGGAPMETLRGDPHHWLLLTVDPDCPAVECTVPALGCPCVSVERRLIGQPPPERYTACRPASVVQ
ncbi:MAG: hypothetical protein KC620_06920 [Myxococcales bacterium]|nr:hypothetical protein [Myxococcales bacterium]